MISLKSISDDMYKQIVKNNKNKYKITTEHWNKNNWKVNTTKNYRIINENNKGIGLVSICPDTINNKLTSLELIEIEPQYRNQGYGSQVMNILKRKTGNKLSLQAYTDDLQNNYYPKFGFKLDGDPKKTGSRMVIK